LLKKVYTVSYKVNKKYFKASFLVLYFFQEECMISAKIIVRALRLDFVMCSFLPYLFGALYFSTTIALLPFLLGAAVVIATHISANLINDYADSRSGADWHDTKYYKYFGGSKLIQHYIFSLSQYLFMAIFFAAAALCAVATLAYVMGRGDIIILWGGACALSWMYSMKPVSFSYRYCGEGIVFILFGIAPVCAGAFLQNPGLAMLSWEGVIASLPFGFMVTAILFVNEIPDYPTDKMSEKHTLVDLLRPERAYMGYVFLHVGAFLSVLWGCHRGFYAPWIAVVAAALWLVSLYGAYIVKEKSQDKSALIMVAKMTIAMFTIMGASLCLGATL
jgi:1,4-dihydroxy-2-naphthoate octaprenyltransferase